jgi:alkylation response protein AidB-like acyl-CoA dehydrogenase
MSAAVRSTLPVVDPEAIRVDLDAMRDAVVRCAGTMSRAQSTDWRQLAATLREVGRIDQCLGRLVEGHADAMRILDQAGASPRDGAYGVWASRSAGTGLRAESTSEGWRLSGTVRFTSGVDLIDRALVPGWVDDENHLLFDVPTADFVADRTGWHTAAMDASRSFSCHCVGLDAGRPIGATNFYLQRPGFAIGGLGPAAVWAGGAQLVTDLVVSASQRFRLSPHQVRRLGTMRQQAWLAQTAVDGVAAVVEQPTCADPTEAVGFARATVAEACDGVLREAAIIVGPAGLTQNVRLIRAHQDLALYARQHHQDATFEQLGCASLPSGDQ